MSPEYRIRRPALLAAVVWPFGVVGCYLSLLLNDVIDFMRSPLGIVPIAAAASLPAVFFGVFERARRWPNFRPWHAVGFAIVWTFAPLNGALVFLLYGIWFYAKLQLGR
jgi:hypothetical protein